MRTYSGLLLTMIIVLCMPSVVYPHSVPTHRNITREAVAYLQRVDRRFACALTLEEKLQIGTAGEDYGLRPLFHFYPQLNRGAFFASCSSLDWGILNSRPYCSNAATFGFSFPNEHTWLQAMMKARENTGSPSEAGWEELGYVLHLLEDLSSPAHTRNDPHPIYDPVESGTEDDTRNPQSPPDSIGLISFSSVEEFFTSLHQITQSNYFSADTIRDPTLIDDSGNLIGPPIGRQDGSYFYDARNANRRIAYKGRRYFESGEDVRKATVDTVIAADQFNELGPVVVQYAASFIRYYYEAASPALCTDPFVVTNTEDGGPGSLRQALLNANTNPGRDTVTFNIPGTGPHTIIPITALPDITDPVVIDGTSQPGFVDKPVIELRNVSTFPNPNPRILAITAGNSTVRGLAIIAQSQYGLELRTAGGNLIEGNYLGTYITGTEGSGVGLHIVGSSTNTIGGTTISKRNIIHGAWVENSHDNRITGNYIGTNAAGTAPFTPTSFGLRIFNDSHNNTVGGTTVGERNVMFNLTIDNSHGTRVTGNYIGTNAAGTSRFPPVIQITSATLINSSNNIIGGTTSAERNVIVYVQLNNSTGNQVLGNYIGIDAPGTHIIGGGAGIQLLNGSINNRIGTLTAGNVVGVRSGSTDGGTAVSADNASSHNIHIEGNAIHGEGGIRIPGGNIFLVNGAGNTIKGNSISPECGGYIAVIRPAGVNQSDNIGFRPDVPRDFSVSGLTSTSAILNWNAVPEVTSYEVNLLTNTGPPVPFTLRTSSLFTPVTGLSPGATYTFTVKTFNNRCDSGGGNFGPSFTTPGVTPQPLGAPILISEETSTRAIALESIVWLRDPLKLDSTVPWGFDNRSRVTLFATNLDLLPEESISVVTVDAEDASHRIYPLTVEYVGKVPGLDWLSNVVVRLHDDMGDVGDVLVRLTVRGVSSNRVRLGVGHVGGGPPDDVGTLPTPGRPPQ